MGFKFPYGNSQQLNLNWFIKKFKELLVDWQHEKESIDGALDAEIQRAEDALSDVYTARDTTIAAKNDALQAKADALTAAANAAQYWQNAAASANSAATSAVTALQAAQDAADNADQTSRDRALVSADKATVAADKATVAADKATVAADKAIVAQDKADTDDIKDAANAAALRSEGWADGTQNGMPVTSGSPYYQNNSKYFKEEAEAVLESIPPDYSDLAAEVATQGEKLGVLNLFEQQFKNYLINAVNGPSGRPVTINGAKITITGRGTSYYCYNVLSKTQTLHYGGGTSSQVDTFLENNKNDVLIPIAAIKPLTQNLFNFIINFKNSFSPTKTNIRIHLCQCTEQNGSVVSIDNKTYIGYSDDTYSGERISAYINGENLKNYTHFAIILISRAGVDQTLYLNMSLILQTMFTAAITSYRFSEYIATTAIAENTLIMVGCLLYKTLTSVANGAQLIVGNNIKATTIAEELTN